jgi:hypothetical protein
LHLHFLSESNLRDKLFVQQYVHAFTPESKVLIIVDSFGDSLRDTRFVTKRLSTLMSEQMVYNNAFSGDQRDMVKLQSTGSLSLRKDFIAGLLEPLQALLIGAIATTQGGPQLIGAEELVMATKAAFELDEVVIFPNNPMSSLAMKPRLISNKKDAETLMEAYEEERTTLERALRLAPARLSGPALHPK